MKYSGKRHWVGASFFFSFGIEKHALELHLLNQASYSCLSCCQVERIQRSWTYQKIPSQLLLVESIVLVEKHCNISPAIEAVIKLNGVWTCLHITAGLTPLTYAVTCCLLILFQEHLCHGLDPAYTVESSHNLLYFHHWGEYGYSNSLLHVYFILS